jgi:tRNA pseudouridine38-40 synthase
VVTRLDLEYDGSDFGGWARQPGRRTVQAAVEAALQRILSRDVALTVAGRTDSGVDASGQVCSYAGPPAPRAGLNALLPDDVAVTAVSEAPDGFDARYSALQRAYRFRLLTRRAPSPFERGRALHVTAPLDRAALDACAAALVGTHDLTAFTPARTDHVLFTRTIDRAAWVDLGPDLLAFEIAAPSFMRHMNRILMGTMLEVATGRRTLDDFRALLAGAPRERAGATAAPDGLCLVGVTYPDGLAFVPANG